MKIYIGTANSMQGYGHLNQRALSPQLLIEFWEIGFRNLETSTHYLGAYEIIK